MRQVEITTELRDKIQSLDFELTATKDILNYIWGQSPVNMEAVKYYTQQQKELFIEFEVAKNALVQMYNIKSGAEWNLDYNTCILYINEGDE